MFQGSIPALVTPFKNNALDRDACVALVNRQVEAGCGGLVPVGTTGESATLSHEEHREVVSLCVETAAGRVPVIAGCGSNSTAEAISLVQYAKQVGADAALVVCPYYNRPDQDGLAAHFLAIADAVALPLILYNVPSRTSSDIAPETVGRLASHPNIIGIKDATGDLSRVTEHRQVASADFVQLSGDDPSALGHVSMGGTGCISVTANVAPELVVEMHKAAQLSDLKTARNFEDRLIALHRALFSSPSPGPAKYALSKLGLCAPDVRLPLTPPNETARRHIDNALTAAGIEVS
ncbi:MAG: 4-hydroxy-tetrahydrodipicolinate synthase [Pseudomonadota bacterium]